MTRSIPPPRPWLDQLEPYSPGVKAQDAAGSLAANEAPEPPGQAVQSAVAQAAAQLNRYPDPLATPLLCALAERHGVAPEQILIGNGSDELIFLLTHAYAAQGGQIVCAAPAYRIDEISALVAHAGVTKVPLRGWAHDLERMAEVPADIAYVVNPHNPAGTVRRPEDISAFATQCRAGLTVVDEAYIDA